MREILFRGKRVKDGKLVDGDLNRYIVPFKPYICKMQENLSTTSHEVIAETIGQYTGLKDKNGRMIFEGDIVNAKDGWWDAAGPAGHSSPIICVSWMEDICGFEPFANYDCDCGVYIEPFECEIIGNIHDNPELLND